MKGWKRNCVLWYILMLAIIPSGLTAKKHHKLGKIIQKDQSMYIPSFFEMSSNQNKKLDVKDIREPCSNESTTSSATCLTSAKNTTKTTAYNRDKQEKDDKNKERKYEDSHSTRKNTQLLVKPTSNKKSETKPTIKCGSCGDKSYVETLKTNLRKYQTKQKQYEAPSHLNSLRRDSNTWKIKRKYEKPRYTNVSQYECSAEILTTVKYDKATLLFDINNINEKNSEIRNINQPVIVGKITVPPISVIPALCQDTPKVPSFLKHYVTFGTFKNLLCPLIKFTNSKDTAQEEWTNTSKNITNFNENPLFSETIQKGGEGNNKIGKITNNQNNWTHHLKARMHEENNEDDEEENNEKQELQTVLINSKENLNFDKIKPINHEDFKKHLTNSFYNNHNHNHNHNKPKNPDNYIALNNLIKHKNLKTEKRNTYKEMNYDSSMLNAFEDENNNLNENNYNSDTNLETEHEMYKFRNILANIIRDLAEDEFMKDNNSAQYFEVASRDNDLMDAKLEDPTTENYAYLDKEPNIQILNITQVFNMYSKLVPIRKYLDALHTSNKVITPIYRTNKNYSENINNTSAVLNYSKEKNNLKKRFEYALIRSFFQQYINNLTDREELNGNCVSNLILCCTTTLCPLNSEIKNPVLKLFDNWSKPTSKKILKDKAKKKKVQPKLSNNENDQLVKAIIGDIIHKSMINNNDFPNNYFQDDPPKPKWNLYLKK